MSTACPICDSPLNNLIPRPEGKDATRYDCPRCGSFMLSGTLVSTLPGIHSKDRDARAKLSHAIRRAQEQNQLPLFTTYTAEAALKHPLPRPREQADLLIRWLAQHVPGPGETIWIEFASHGSIVGSKSPAGFTLIVEHLFTTNLLTGTQVKTLDGGVRAAATLSFEGWDYYERLLSGSAVYRKGFMAMKFGEPELEKILEDVFKPSARRAGFELSKLDDVPKAGLIDDRLRVEIQTSDFLVADLTHDNLGAYWEAGYAEGLGKPVIYTCEKARFAAAKTHFDTNHHLTILWDKQSPSAAGNELTATIRATLPHLARLNGDDA